ncbi:MAG: PhnD/SsuA/transferrin family substrate-binding protein, partial [Sulfurovum sp.]|nr:PhnD/SsuA/transferrin family substrate-binding protein [Sulfurovum sp.]
GEKFRGIIIVRPDSGIKSVADLKDKQIMIVGKTSAGGYLSQKLTLQKQGIPLPGENMSEAADNRQENVIIAVSIGDVDAGFIRESALHKADKYIMPRSIKVLAPTAWLPNWAFSVNRNMPQAQKKALLNSLLALQKESIVLKAFNQGDISLGQLSRALDLTKEETLKYLTVVNIPTTDYDLD